MKKVLMSLFISVVTISTLWASDEVVIKDINWNEDTDRSISGVPSVTIQNDILYVITEKHLENLSIEIQNLSGNTIIQQDNIMIPADETFSIYIGNLPENDYLLIMRQEKKYVIFSFIK